MTNIRNTEWFSQYRSCIEQGDLQNAKKVLLRNISNDDVIYTAILPSCPIPQEDRHRQKSKSPD